MKSAFVLMFLFLSGTVMSQQTDTLIKKLDSLQVKKDSAGGQTNNIQKEAYNEQTQITLKSYFILLGSDFKQQLTAPFHGTKKQWTRAAEFALAEVALSFADKPIQKNALKLRNDNTGIRKVSSYVTNFGSSYEAITLAAMGTFGWLFKKEKMKTTTLLASQAYLTGGAMEYLLKALSGRQRPNFYEIGHPDPRPRFHGPFNSGGRDIDGKKVNSSFPSGHTTVAFAAATVFAMEYKTSTIIPLISYSAATLIGLSRITENKHWLTDVVAGAGLGYLIGQQVVNNYHRYAKLKDPKQAGNSISFSLNYSSYVGMMPGVVYKFR
ncbi:MAG: phosphatase family protein [Chitinophagaceae bacterium]|nr:phosphatase family protein [Chitinophagaceae bacterium]